MPKLFVLFGLLFTNGKKWHIGWKNIIKHMFISVMNKILNFFWQRLKILNFLILVTDIAYVLLCNIPMVQIYWWKWEHFWNVGMHEGAIIDWLTGTRGGDRPGLSVHFVIRWLPQGLLGRSWVIDNVHVSTFGTQETGVSKYKFPVFPTHFCIIYD